MDHRSRRDQRAGDVESAEHIRQIVRNSHRHVTYHPVTCRVLRTVHAALQHMIPAGSGDIRDLVILPVNQEI